MRYLLDTHTVLWYALNNPKLSATARGLIEDTVDLCLNVHGFGILPIEPSHLMQVAALAFPPNHKDPFDRLLISQAMVENVPVVGSDAAFDDYPVRRIWS